ncbi:cytosolic phospholipase A2 gamma-like isoform X2 [Sebastes umbrosus]|uniref:cytosolic phospholipase A2 gamma-like isoform X2 n=1 Tax=Sebastes umbrosus TaxID=72105 RepID=UPI00189DD61A|nr:cytosolic phospholipase A2 gamma-like isoform X2 [Sebastes umbrosus]
MYLFDVNGILISHEDVRQQDIKKDGSSYPFQNNPYTVQSPTMQSGKAGWVAALLCACMVMLGPMGQPVDNREDMSTVTPQIEGVSSEEMMPTSAADAEMNSSFALEHYVRQSQSLSAGEQEFVLKRKQVALKSLNRLGIECSLDSVPHIALLGSGGGQRAVVGLVGSLYQMEKEGLLDTVLYLGGVSGSAWSMSSLYSDPQWSSNMDTAVSKLSGPGVGPEEALAWLGERAKGEYFSLTDIWGVIISAGITKQLDLRHLSGDGMDAFNPYPIYNAVNKNCLQHGPENAKWFEMTPHEAGFTDLGLFINTSHVGSKIHEADPEGQGPEMDMTQLQGIVGSAVADEQSLVNYMPDWLKGLVASAATDEDNLLDVVFLWTEVPQQIKSSWDVLARYARGYQSLLKLTEVIRKNTEDAAVLSDLDNLQKTLKENMNINPLASFGKKSPEQQKLILEQWRQKMLAPVHIWSQSLDEGPAKEIVSWLIQNAIPLIGKWEWGTTENFLYQYPGAEVPSCISLEEHLQLIDTGVMLNTPYPTFLGEKRDADLLIDLDYGADDTFKTLTLTREYAAAVKKPFPEINETMLEERDWPKDCYVFEGKEKEPTIVYMPLFNRRNCKDAEEVKAKMEEFSTFQPPYSQDKIEFLLETAKANIKNNKETLQREIYKAALRRHDKR